MFNVTFNDILSYIMVLSLLMKEAEVPEENRPTNRNSLRNFIT
jgi:hypothetical protein